MTIEATPRWRASWIAVSPMPLEPPVHQKPLALLQSSQVDQVGPDGEPGFRQCRRLCHVQAGRNRQGMRSRRHAILGIAAARHQRRDTVADFPFADALAQRGYRAGDLRAEDGARRPGGGG
ncbi:MAG: hypothetical protein M5R42_13665 [Rhodocyclaceae bacterium]|nr:hypothetical protein [Rhodocyclaceae bacterium]